MNPVAGFCGSFMTNPRAELFSRYDSNGGLRMHPVEPRKSRTKRQLEVSHIELSGSGNPNAATRTGYRLVLIFKVKWGVERGRVP